MNIFFPSAFFETAKKTAYKLLFKLIYPSVDIVDYPSYHRFYSQRGQDVFLAAILHKLIFNHREYKYVVDIGANRPVIYSNSYYFENYDHLKIIAIDPLKVFSGQWKVIRPNAELIHCAIGLNEDYVELSTPKLDISNHNLAPLDMFSTVGSNKSSRLAFLFHETNKQIVPMRTLASILEERQINNILFCSIDVEGMEMDVLMSIDFDAINCACFLVENNCSFPFGSRKIRTFLRDKGYHYLARVWGLDDIFIRRSLLDYLLSPSS